jgi:hypothetical protein
MILDKIVFTDYFFCKLQNFKKRKILNSKTLSMQDKLKTNQKSRQPKFKLSRCALNKFFSNKKIIKRKQLKIFFN